jgi:hypothetical protein
MIEQSKTCGDHVEPSAIQNLKWIGDSTQSAGDGGSGDSVRRSRENDKARACKWENAESELQR